MRCNVPRTHLAGGFDQLGLSDAAHPDASISHSLSCGQDRRTPRQAGDRITVSPPDRQPPRRFRRGGKSGLHRESCRLTAGGPLSKAVHGKCHRNIPPGFGRVRVKWCGKSAPRPERFGWQRKPHGEQDQIEDKRRPVAFESRVGCMSPAAMPDLVEWLPPWSTKAQKPAYRPAGSENFGSLTC